MTDIIINAWPAFFVRGSLNAVIPFEIASTPVKAVVPLAKAFKIRKVEIATNGPSYCKAGGFTT